MIITVGGLDPSLRNFGLAKGTYDTAKDLAYMNAIRTEVTEPEAGKTVRKSSDDLRCAGLLVYAMQAWIKDCDVVFAEIPSGSQSARGSFSNGICLGVMGSVGVIGGHKGKLIQVNPLEVKRAAVGSKNASKEEMVEWASKKYPNLPWIKGKVGKYKGIISVAANEHMADAVAAINAGIRTDEFSTLVAMYESVQSREKLALTP